ncbi:hypothetical protein CDD81_4096 [Ophiocordyceps australis]|uniref:Glutathione S-transferase kappa n=1 Tax=Ophiocordyceps australis TaxID=1399860 RepID=A0A2C5Y588_9HYPO|nr:hypothetical protein CDD81_4096 [Ophiocordyceps australis]
MAGGRIDCYFDIVSPYAYVAVVRLLRDLDTLTAYGVVVDFHPMFLGAIMNASGNKPPWTLPAKALYLAHDRERSTAAVGITCGSPSNLFELAKTQSPLRALLAIKATYPPSIYTATILHLFRFFWTPPHRPLANDAVLQDALAGVQVNGKRVFDAAQVAHIMQAREEYKQTLVDEVQSAREKGAFGAPWLWVTNAKGESQPFFGSDRFNQVFRFLGLDFHDVELLPPSAKL